MPEDHGSASTAGPASASAATSLSSVAGPAPVRAAAGDASASSGSSGGGSVRMLMTMRERMTAAGTRSPARRVGPRATERRPAEEDAPGGGSRSSAPSDGSASGSDAGRSTIVGSLLEQVDGGSGGSGERLFALRALRELTAHDDRARRLVVSLPDGCSSLVRCCSGGMNALVAELSEAGTTAWESLVQVQAIALQVIAQCIRDDASRQRFAGVSREWWTTKFSICADPAMPASPWTAARSPPRSTSRRSEKIEWRR